jgi:hypothetical protein
MEAAFCLKAIYNKNIGASHIILHADLHSYAVKMNTNFLINTNMATMRNLKIIFDKCNVVRIYTGGNYSQ